MYFRLVLIFIIVAIGYAYIRNQKEISLVPTDPFSGVVASLLLLLTWKEKNSLKLKSNFDYVYYFLKECRSFAIKKTRYLYFRTFAYLFSPWVPVCLFCVWFLPALSSLIPEAGLTLRRFSWSHILRQFNFHITTSSSTLISSKDWSSNSAILFQHVILSPAMLRCISYQIKKR